MLNIVGNPNCGPAQVISLNFPITDFTCISIFDKDGNPIDLNEVEFGYSIDGVCWSCYGTYDDVLKNIIELKQDFFLRIRLHKEFSKICINNEEYTDYTTQLDSAFQLKGEVSTDYTFNPYANLDGAIGLQQQLTNTVSSLFGVPIYYFKVDPVVNSKDYTFKEYCLMGVSSVKQLKLIIANGQMPSSKPEFTDLGLDWQVDWETEISKASFATAFGNTAKPMEGDLIYIPMMKRMWMVNSAYDEKNGSLMWNSTTFKIMLVKYQEKGSLDLGDSDTLIQSVVKNKYEDLFGEDENIESQEQSTETPLYYADNNAYPIYGSDATRKYMTCDTIDYIEDKYYYKGVLISDIQYKMSKPKDPYKKTFISYQHKYCGDEGVISFIIKPSIAGVEEKGTIIQIGTLKINIEYGVNICKIIFNEISVDLIPNKMYFVYCRWCEKLNQIDLHAYEYIKREDIPIYKLQPSHYYFDINEDKKCNKVERYDIELTQDQKQDVIVYYDSGIISNIKIFDCYIDDVNDILQMYPTNQHLIINDTANRVIEINSSSQPSGGF